MSRYLDFSNVVNTTHLPFSIESHTAFIKCQYDHACGGGGKDADGNVVPPSTEWCYQMDSVVNYLKKSVYEVISLQDNNIIGYDSQNINCGFDIRRLLQVVATGNVDIDAVNTPIQYTDDNGRVMGFTISMMNNTNLKKVWDIYKTDKEQQYSTTYSGSLYNRCVFIPTELFDMSVEYADYLISDFTYEKDAIEVPIFEYVCQVDDSDDVSKGTAKTRGSQAKVEDKGKRDYNRVTWNGKTLTKEYSRNVRGKRLNLSKISSYVVDGNGEVKFINREANAYFNTHYHYIEKMMNEQGILDILANEFGLTRKRTQSTGLLEDFLSQGDNEPSIVEAVMSHFNNE